MNQHQTSFARSLPPRVAAIGRTIESPPLGRPATFNHDQMYDGRRAGARSWGCGRHAPVRINLFCGQGSNYVKSTGRGFGLGIFSVATERDCNRALAKFVKSQARGAVQGYSDLPEIIHSKISLRLGPEPSEGGKNAIHENPTSGATHDR